MSYILLVVVVLFVLFAAYREREARLERQELGRAHARQVSELLTRITHPDVALVPVEDTKKVSPPDVDPEVDEFSMVGSIIPGASD